MADTQLHELTAEQAVSLLRVGAVSPTELVNAAAVRIEAAASRRAEDPVRVLRCGIAARGRRRHVEILYARCSRALGSIPKRPSVFIVTYGY